MVAPAASVSAPDKVRPHVVTAQSDEIEMLLASVMNWQPRSYFGGAFGSDMGGASQGMGASALSFGAGLLSVLSEGRPTAR